LGVALSATVLSGAARGDESPYNLENFRGSLVFAEQTNGANSFSIGASWNPTYELPSGFGLEGQLGLGLFSTALGGDFTVVDYEVLATYAATPQFSVELGGGAQYWSGAGGNVNSPAISLNGVYQLSSKGPIKALFVGYTDVLVQSLPTSVFRVGFEL
jgi:hypothetical protein